MAETTANPVPTMTAADAVADAPAPAEVAQDATTRVADDAGVARVAAEDGDASPIARIETGVDTPDTADHTVEKKRTRAAEVSDDLTCAESIADELRDVCDFNTSVVARFRFPEVEPSVGDVITFVREPDNKVDEYAVLARANGKYCGYVQAASAPTHTGSTHARAVSELMQLEMSGEPLVEVSAKVVSGGSQATANTWDLDSTETRVPPAKRFVVDNGPLLLNVTVATKRRGAVFQHVATTAEAILDRHGVVSMPCI